MNNKLRQLYLNLRKRKIITFLLLVVVMLIISLFIQQNRIQEKIEKAEKFFEERRDLEQEFNDFIREHDDLLKQYGDVSDELNKKDSIIQQQIREIEGLSINNQRELREARNKIAVLKKISMKYVADLDSLVKINKILILEKDSVIDRNKEINWEKYKLNKKLEKLSEKVVKGSMLEVTGLDVETIRYRKTGREVKTGYANKVQKIRVCFSVASNQIADSENKKAYIQIINEQDELIQSDNFDEIIIADTALRFTAQTIFEYSNLKMEHCFEWERINVLSPGNYIVKLIVESDFSAETNFKLK